LPPRLPPILTVAVVSLVGIGCGGDDDSSDSAADAPKPCQRETFPAPVGNDAFSARQAAVAYFLSCDPNACTAGATKNHIRADYGGSLSRCETVRRNNRLSPDDVKIAGDAKVDGPEAEVRGQVLITGETFVIELKEVDGSWKVDRIRGSQ
jgi:hypothetical protein